MLMRLKTFRISFIILVLAAGSAFAAFETMPELSVRAQGMGNAFCGMSDDVMSTLINPAGLSKLDRTSVGLSYASLYPGLINDSISQGMLAAAIRGDITAWGLTVNQLSSAKYKETMYVLTPSYRVADSLLLGANIKYMGWSAATLQYFNDTSETLGKSVYGLDLGCQYLVSDNLTLGLSLSNLNRPDVGEIGQELLPINVRTGVWYSRPSGLNLGADMIMEESRQSFALGLEQWFVGNRFGLRGGWEGEVNGGNISVGASYRQGDPKSSPFGVDAAYVFPIVMENMPVMRISTTFKFGEKIAKAPEPEPGITSEIAAPSPVDQKRAQRNEAIGKILDMMGKIQIGELTQIKFEPVSDKISQGYDTLDVLGKILLNYPALNIRIEVYTDPLGDPDANMALTYAQGESIKSYLVKQFKIDANRMEVVGFGGSRPIASVNDPEGIERNRRVEIHVQE